SNILAKSSQALEKWLGDRTCFTEVEQERISMHHQKTNHLLIQTSTYGRAEAFLLEIINMKPPTGKFDIHHGVRIHGRCPGPHCNKVVTACYAQVLECRFLTGGCERCGG
ncbi:hypothetical protein VP01_9783g1, partial [Puccinia sorghi]